MKIRALLVLVFTTSAFFESLAQDQKLRVRKEKTLYFFQEGKCTDTITNTKGNYFRLFVHEDLKKDLSIDIENGRLEPAGNDSIWRFQHLPGLKYELTYIKSDTGSSNKTRAVYKAFVGINGASALPPDQIQIYVRDRSGSVPEIKNKFYFKS